MLVPQIGNWIWEVEKSNKSEEKGETGHSNSNKREKLSS